MTNNFNYKIITQSQIEDVLYLIAAYAGKPQASRFNKLDFEKKQKVAFILKKRAKRAKNHEQPIDIFIVREVIDDANKDLFVYE